MRPAGNLDAAFGCADIYAAGQCDGSFANHVRATYLREALIDNCGKSARLEAEIGYLLHRLHAVGLTAKEKARCVELHKATRA
jgi:hypothetical protein